MNRRSALRLGLATFASGIAARASAQTSAVLQTGPKPPAGVTIPLWSGGPPADPDVVASLRASGLHTLNPGTADMAVSNISDPVLTFFRSDRPDGSAVLIIPGGGYLRETIVREGVDTAQRFAAEGVSAFVLLYRLPGEGWRERMEVPLDDAKQAMRVIRAGATSYGIDPARIGALGFSAGGHLAGLLATRGGDLRPAFFALGYPVVTMLKPFAHEASREHLFGRDASPSERAAYSIERLVQPSTPPVFLFAAEDDPDVSPENALMLQASLRSNGVPVELHLFERGGHGFGLGDPRLTASAWPDLLLRWGRSRGYFRQT